MQELVQQEIMNFVKEVVRRFNPERIILFGSYASGSITPDSDVDLLWLWTFKADRTNRHLRFGKP